MTILKGRKGVKKKSYNKNLISDVLHQPLLPRALVH